MTPTEPPGRSRLPAWVGDLLAAAVVVVTTLVPGPPPGPGPHHPLADALPLGVLLAALVLIPLRRRWPVPVLGASLVLYCLTAVPDRASMSVGIVAVLAAYSTGYRTTRLVTLVAGGIATGLVAGLSLTVSDFGVVDPRIFQVAAGVAVAAALGDSSRSHREYVRAATERAQRAEETREAEAQRRVAEERLRIARDLHDTVAHQISVISLSAGVASGALDGDPEKARLALATIRTASRRVLTEIGDLLRYLRTDAEGLSASAPQPGLDDVDALVAQFTEAGLDVELRRSGDLARVTGSAGIVAYRVVQESLTNAHKYGSRRTASLRLEVREDALTITVTNPVTDPATDLATGTVLPGTANQPEPPRGGLGLTGIRERIASVGGTVRTAATEDGFALVARVPLR